MCYKKWKRLFQRIPMLRSIIWYIVNSKKYSVRKKNKFYKQDRDTQFFSYNDFVTRPDSFLCLIKLYSVNFLNGITMNSIIYRYIMMSRFLAVKGIRSLNYDRYVRCWSRNIFGMIISRLDKILIMNIIADTFLTKKNCFACYLFTLIILYS